MPSSTIQVQPCIADGSAFCMAVLQGSLRHRSPAPQSLAPSRLAQSWQSTSSSIQGEERIGILGSGKIRIGGGRACSGARLCTRASSMSAGGDSGGASSSSSSSSSQDPGQSLGEKFNNFIQAFWKFVRPHTIRGTVSVLA